MRRESLVYRFRFTLIASEVKSEKFSFAKPTSIPLQKLSLQIETLIEPIRHPPDIYTYLGLEVLSLRVRIGWRIVCWATNCLNVIPPLQSSAPTSQPKPLSSPRRKIPPTTNPSKNAPMELYLHKAVLSPPPIKKSYSALSTQKERILSHDSIAQNQEKIGTRTRTMITL